VASKITADVLILAGERAEHCQLGAQTLWQADFFDWMKRFDNSKSSW
jgi:hypothetical protein